MSITVTNNSDGTFTVSCGADSVIVGTPSSKKSGGVGNRVSRPGGHVSTVVSRPGGFVTANIIDSAGAPAGSKRARNGNDLIAKLKSQVKAVTIASAAGKKQGNPKDLHFSLSGRHTIDVSKIARLTVGGGTAPAVVAHIHIKRRRG